MTEEAHVKTVSLLPDRLDDHLVFALQTGRKELLPSDERITEIVEKSMKVDDPEVQQVILEGWIKFSRQAVELLIESRDVIRELKNEVEDCIENHN